MRKAEEEQGGRWRLVVANTLLGGVVALLACLAFLFGCAIAISEGWLNPDWMHQLTVVGCVLGSFWGSFYSIGKCGGAPLPVGLATGGVLFLLLLTGGLLIERPMPLSPGGLALLLGCLCGGGVAAILRAGVKKKRKKR